MGPDQLDYFATPEGETAATPAAERLTPAAAVPAPPPPPAPSGTIGVPVAYARWFQRGGALILDALLMFVASMAVSAFIVELVSTLGASLRVVTVLVTVTTTFGPMAYIVVLEATRGQTVGKMAARIKVVRPDGQTIGYGRATGRYAARILSAVPAYLGYLWPLWDARRQTFHDKIVDTIVIQTSRP